MGAPKGDDMEVDPKPPALFCWLLDPKPVAAPPPPTPKVLLDAPKVDPAPPGVPPAPKEL